ncbi:MAG: ATP-dependent DNA helicase [Deltaproteobacteria bacterium]|nr:ATP-dependent DNA helicase [Deltaproteobacteria bacterium]
MEKIFGKDGLLSRVLEDYEYRSVQETMALEVGGAISEGRASIIEAGTGTGKTLAYLIPALLSQKKTIISTGTKTLQDQLLDKDIPFLKKHISQPFRAVCMKGRANYLCLYRFHRSIEQPDLLPEDNKELTKTFIDWAQQTASGDRAEIHWLPDDFAGWEPVSARGDRCLGQKCPMFEQCFLTNLRQEAANAEIVVVNHHLFFADLAVRYGGYGQVIPPYEVVIFDEAHLLEETANSYFSIQTSSYRVLELFRDISGEMAAIRSKNTSLSRSLQNLGKLAVQFFEGFPASDKRERLQPETIPLEVNQRWSKLRVSLDQLIGDLFRQQELSEGLSSCHKRALEIKQALELITDQRDPNYVYWYETRGKGKFLWASPVQVAPILEECLFHRTRPYIFTSATLAVAKSLEFFKKRIGLPQETKGLILDAPFFYGEQALIYLPKHLPLPDSANFIPALTKEVEAILAETGGRAFILFTSHRNLREVFSRLSQMNSHTLLVQGEQPKATLLKRFREDTSSVLLGTASFWQGIDMPGETLSCVIIDKLPFAPPNDPLVAARLEKIAEAGGNPFWDYQVPSAVLTLRQGLGRLIRRATDTGVLAVLDSRLFKRSYGKIFLESLPESTITHRREDIGEFLS